LAEVPFRFLIYFRLKQSFLAFCTGALLGSFIQTPFLTLPGGIVGVIVYQFAFRNLMTGKRQGELEYAYWEHLAEQKVRRTLAKVAQRPRFPNLLDMDLLDFDSQAYNPWLATEAEREGDPERQFLLYLTIGSQALKGDAYPKAAEALRQAVQVRSHDLVANFRLAAILEHLGQGAEAIRHYEASMGDPGLASPELKEFVQSQIERVKTQGPRKGSKVQGLRYKWF
jgi:tetratricopeptide (TPR) repeat protein